MRKFRIVNNYKKALWWVAFLVSPAVSFIYLFNTVGAGGAYGQYMVYAALAGYVGGMMPGILFGAVFFPVGMFLSAQIEGNTGPLLVNHLVTGVLLSAVGGAFGYLSELRESLRMTLEDLKLKERQLGLAEEAGHVGLWALDDPIRRTGKASANFYKIFGVQTVPEASTVQDWLSWIHPDDQKRAVQDFERASRREGRFNFQFRVLWPDKSTHWVEVNGAVALGPEGLPKSVMGSVADVTEAKKIQAQLEQQRVILVTGAKMSALGEMSGGIAHEINNPIGIIHGKSNQLLKLIRRGKFTAEVGIQELEKIISTSERIAKIIRGLRSFSRNADMDPTAPVALGVLIQNVLDFCSEKFLSLNIRLEVGTIPQIKLDCRSVQIEQVLLNLLNNAHDAVIDLADKWVRIECQVEAERLEIAVTDSGPGIPPGVAEKLMQPFFTTKEVGKGTGLGLSISKGIIEDHHGELRYDVSSAHTRFVIRMPLKQSRQALKTA